MKALESIDIRVATEEDSPNIAKFAITLSEDPEDSVKKWIKVIQEENVYPLIAVVNSKIVGKVQARIVKDIGYFESARVSPDYRKQGIAGSLIDSAMDWLISQNVKHIRSLVDSDNLPARLILERNNFVGHFLVINPSTQVLDTDASPEYTDEFTTILDNYFYEEFAPKLKESYVGNILIDGQFIPFTQELFDNLIQNRVMMTNNERDTFIVKSYHTLPAEFHACVISTTVEGYRKAGLAVRAYAAQEMASVAVCYAPSNKTSLQGLIRADFGWNQPHSVILYQRDPWEHKSRLNRGNINQV